MSEKAPHYIPHLLCQSDTKVNRNNLENIDEYVSESPNPRWAASHLVRAISTGLIKVDTKIATQLAEIADQLAASNYTQ